MGHGAGSGAIGAPIARLLANMVVMGSGVLGRHFLQAYKEALANGGKAAGAAAGSAARESLKRSGMPDGEARMILNVKPKAPDAEILEASEKLAAMNDPEKGGSKYLQQKIVNARDSLIEPEEASKGASQ